MKRLKTTKVLLMLLTLMFGITALAQNSKKSIVSGTVVETATNLPLEYASIFAQNENNANIVSGGMTDSKGHYSFEVPNGSYYIKIEFLGYKTIELHKVAVNGDTNLGVKKVADDNQMLDEVLVIAEKSTVDIKLDKKVYNVGQDMIVKGGTAGDVLDNVPSVTVDSEGAVSLRGNENVKVLIDGKPTGLANNIQEAMRILSAESIDKVEVITNPSARYEAEGGAGIINIVLKKGKAQGINGNVTATVGDPRNYGLSGNVNIRGEKYNFYTTLSYRDGKVKGYGRNNNQYLDAKGNTTQFINEYKDNNRDRESYDGTFGLDYYLTPSLTWSNNVTVRRTNGSAYNTVDYQYYDPSYVLQYNRDRIENRKSDYNSVEYSTSFEKKFKKEDHKLTVEATISQDRSNDMANISDINDHLNKMSYERNSNNDKYKNGLVKVDYTLPIGKNGNFEAGYLGTFKTTTNNFSLANLTGNQWVTNTKVSNILEYKEQVNAFYAQYGDKITDKLNFMVGLRWEKSNIDVNQLVSKDFNNKKYDDFFPSLFLNYELDDSSSLSVSYSKRIMRPRGHFLNPFSNYTSDINFFQGNPNLDPAKTNAFDLGYLKRWSGFTLSASAYLNKTDDTFQFVKRIAGTNASGTPITVSSPINLATEYRYGFDFTLNYTPFKWWKLNGNFNFYRSEINGDYTFTNFDGTVEKENFDQNTYAWFTRITSKITLPYKIDWQVNGMYRAPYDTSQGRAKGNLSANTSLSKDILKDKATITFNVSDIFNSRKRESDTYLPQSISHSEMQWRGRQINLSFTYRFNQSKMNRQKQQKPGNGDGEQGGGEMEMM
ncbi:TonB-dependent receptor [Myroides marinus]|uniref:Outer membrane receptor proteins, mostly Fe transport n=1 Tax=Myroides marinus TaxID=703342 RepID=A0A163X8F5_9FLAO|nr:TonB-dependent receptor [Myroides marinus]KZE77481.1 TonB-dependent receptor [Myroides marinus]MDM1346782.1 TonB-dependent receptor [Myroides marinus]MDM1350459.1 TonB-dependent receptor [Myroides marinus]MDM1357666.1 TonB-dependent receptor [Myroides marinus]MDM1361499.1 TonB-dependent receptor [Myroides marinus]